MAKKEDLRDITACYPSVSQMFPQSLLCGVLCPTKAHSTKAVSISSFKVYNHSVSIVLQWLICLIIKSKFLTNSMFTTIYVQH